MFAMLDQAPPYHMLAAAERPALVAQATPAGTVPPLLAAPSPTPAARQEAEATRQEVDSHGYHYILIGNHLLSRAEVSAAIESGGTPQAAVGALKKAYESKGYFLVALVGKAQGKEVWLQIVQGRLTHVDGPHDLARYFSGLKGDDTIRTSDVIRRSTLAQAYAATNGKQPQISFKPAPEVGGSSMEIGQTDLAGSHPVGGSLTAGNFGNRYAGHYLAQAQAYAHHDGLTLQLSHSRALTGMDANTHGAYYSASSANLSDVTPWGTFELDGTKTHYELGEKFAPLFPAGRITVFGGSATQLLYADDLRRWSLQEGVHRIHDGSTVFGGSYTLRNQKFTVWDASTDYARRFAGLGGHVASISLSGGVKLGGASHGNGFSQTEGSPTPHFQVYTASAGVTQALAHDFTVQFNLSGQASNQILPSYEQWVLGGLNNLTAWLPGTIVGDRGYLGRLTLQGPQWTVGPLQLRPSLFTEYGAARYSFIPANTPTWQSMDDVGASLSASLPVAHTSAILAYAKPMDAEHLDPALRHGQQAHLFFYLQVGF